MAHYSFSRQFTSPYSPPEVFRALDSHLVEKLGGSVHFNKALEKYVVKGPKRGIGFGPLMNLKIIMDLQTDHKGGYIIDVDMERKPSALCWWSIPVGILLTLMGVPLFWAPLLYFSTSPSRDIQSVIDSFIRKMNSPVSVGVQPQREVYRAIILEGSVDESTHAVPEGKVFMRDTVRRILGLSLILVLFGIFILLIGLTGISAGGSARTFAIIGGAIGLIGGGLGLVYALVKMGRDHL